MTRRPSRPQRSKPPATRSGCRPPTDGPPRPCEPGLGGLNTRVGRGRPWPLIDISDAVRAKAPFRLARRRMRREALLLARGRRTREYQRDGLRSGVGRPRRGMASAAAAARTGHCERLNTGIGHRRSPTGPAADCYEHEGTGSSCPDGDEMPRRSGAKRRWPLPLGALRVDADIRPAGLRRLRAHRGGRGRPVIP